MTDIIWTCIQNDYEDLFGKKHTISFRQFNKNILIKHGIQGHSGSKILEEVRINGELKLYGLYKGYPPAFTISNPASARVIY